MSHTRESLGWAELVQVEAHRIGRSTSDVTRVVRELTGNRIALAGLGHVGQILAEPGMGFNQLPSICGGVGDAQLLGIPVVDDL